MGVVVWKEQLFRCFRSYEESSDAYLADFQARLPQLQEIVLFFVPRGVFNADEFGLFYKRFPNTIIGPRPLQERKVNKDRIKFLPCGSSARSELLPAWWWRVRRPECLGESRNRLGFDYESEPKARMNSIIFFRWLLCLLPRCLRLLNEDFYSYCISPHATGRLQSFLNCVRSLLCYCPKALHLYYNRWTPESSSLSKFAE